MNRIVPIAPAGRGTVRAVHADAIPSPEQSFGHPVGADRKLVAYPRVLEYLEGVAAASDRVSIEEGGSSTLGNRMPIVVLTSSENQADLPNLREMARRLALPGGMSEGEARQLTDDGKVIALVTWARFQ